MSQARQTRVVAVVDDIFFASKIKEAAKSTGVKLDFVKNSDGFIEDIKIDPPTLIILDLNSKKLKPLELIQELKSCQELKNISTLGYLPHVEEKLKKEAINSGADIVMPRSRFVRELVSILENIN
ncbi:MAG: response regulator [Thermodesulfobacteriota bacterium]